MSSRFRVAYLIYGAGLGGGELLLANHLAHASRDEYEPIVVCTHDGQLADRLRTLQVAVFFLPLDREGSLFGSMARPHLRTALRLARLIKTERCDLIHSYSMETRNYAHAAALLTGRPLIHTSQDTTFGSVFGRAQWWALNRIPARIIATSEIVSRGLYVGDRLDPSRVLIIKPGIDLSAFCARHDTSSVRSEFGIAAEAPVVGIVGRYSADKGFELFFAAAERVFREVPDARFLVVGGPVLGWDNYGGEIQRLIGAHGLKDRVVLTGYRSDVPRMIQAMDVLVSSSPSESFGLTLAEAAASERPVVATRSGGAEEIVVDGITGLLVPLADPAALASAVTKLLANPEYAKAMGQAGFHRAVELFDIRSMVRAIEAEYGQVLGHINGTGKS